MCEIKNDVALSPVTLTAAPVLQKERVGRRLGSGVYECDSSVNAKNGKAQTGAGGRRSNIHFTLPLHILTDAVCFDLSLADPHLSVGHCPESYLAILAVLEP